MPVKFTPGPWKAVLNTSPAAIPGHLIKTNDSVERPIAALWEGGGTRGKPEQIANAQLISAAPELYEALVWLISSIPHHEGDDNLTEPLAAAESALRKARGEK